MFDEQSIILLINLSVESVIDKADQVGEAQSITLLNSKQHIFYIIRLYALEGRWGIGGWGF